MDTISWGNARFALPLAETKAMLWGGNRIHYLLERSAYLVNHQ